MYSFVDYRITDEELTNLKRCGVIPIKVPKTNLVYDAINGHPDIQLAVVDSNVIVHKDIDTSFIKILKNFNILYYFSENSLEYKYPGDIILNGLITNDFFMHNIKFTDNNLLIATKNKLQLNVKQGYTKCSVLKIKENAFITSDKLIYNTLMEENFDCLLVPPGDIILPGLNYGFIGGTGGMVSKNEIAFFGNLNNYLYGEKIKSFLKKHDVIPIYLSNSKLIDRGSIISI